MMSRFQHGNNVQCFNSASRRKSNLKKLENPRGSKPTSPGAEPSNFGGRSKNGTEGLASIENRALVAGAVREERRTPAKEEDGVTAAPPKAETNAYIVILAGVCDRKTGNLQKDEMKDGSKSIARITQEFNR